MEISDKDLGLLLKNFTFIKARAGKLNKISSILKEDEVNYKKSQSTLDLSREFHRVIYEINEYIATIDIKLKKAEKISSKLYGLSVSFNKNIPKILCERSTRYQPSKQEALDDFLSYYINSEWSSYMGYAEYSQIFQEFSIPYLLDGFSMCEVMDLFEEQN